MSKSSIQILPEHLIDQIKAGEVIERPSSLLKELIENSIDAGAQNIDIHIQNHGLNLISIQDDGNGMSFDELPYAFVRHATSKLSRFEDLYSLHSYGFRGEALASAASISRIDCISVPSDSLNLGGKIQLEGSKVEGHSPFEGSSCGTSIIIKDLFYNTPVRLNFLKSGISENNALRKIFYSFLLSNPSVSFSLKLDDKEKEYYPATHSVKQRVCDIFFKKNKRIKSENLIHFKQEYDSHIVEAFISQEASKGASGKQQFLSINKRYFFDKVLHQTIIRKMSQTWGHGNYGHYFLNIDVPPREIDVNVHPNKLEVKLHNPTVLSSLISAGISSSIETTPLKNEFPPFSKRSESSLPSISSSTQQSIEQYQHFRNKETTSEEKERLFYQALSHRFFYQSESQRVFDLQFFVLKKLENLFSDYVTEDQITPLLVSEPFYFSKEIDVFFKDLEKYGLCFERINQSTCLLRTIPQIIQNFRPTQLLNSLMKHLSMHDKDSLENALSLFFQNLELDLIDANFNQNQLNELFKEQLYKQGSFILSDELLLKLVQERAHE